MKQDDPGAPAPLWCLEVKRYTGLNWLGDEFNNTLNWLQISASPFLAGGSWRELVAQLSVDQIREEDSRLG